jgi:hypothetical protein
MWKYGYKFYENSDSVGPVHVEMEMAIWYEAAKLFRTVNGVARMTIYTQGSDKHRSVIRQMVVPTGTTVRHSDIMVSPGHSLLVGFEGIKKKEHSMLAKRVVLHLHRANKQMQIVDETLTMDYTTIGEPVDVFNHKWK